MSAAIPPGHEPVIGPEDAVIDADTSGVAQGVRWTTISAIVLRASQFLTGVLAARIVAPSQFGVFAVALTIYSVMLTLSDMGVTQALVREVHRTRLIAPTVNTINLGFAVVMAGILALCAHPLASLLNEPSATPALQVLSLTLVLAALGSVPAQILTRDYRQRQRFMSDLSNFIVSSGSLVLLALHGDGAMALAWSRCLGMAASAIVLNLVNRERYGYGFNRTEAARLFRFGLPLAGAGVLTVAIGDVDSIVIARVLGANSLGHYNLAYTVAAWPLGIFTSVLATITVTTFARAQQDLGQLREHVSAAVSTAVGLAFPICAVLAALSPDLIHVVYGARWLSAAPVLTILSVLTAVRVVQLVLTDLLVALGHTASVLWVQIVWLGALVPVMIGGVELGGIRGAGLAHVTVALLVVGPALLFAVRRRSGISAGWFSRLLLAPTVGAAAAFLAAEGVSRVLSGALLTLFVGGAAGVVVYVLVCWRWLRAQASTIRDRYTRS
ncbi:lipopolysaccharide biosynthesis protein [Flexivirga caeni]|uniref:Lipopolysaccharide biosynthesis protein n=1 Tax=Flexivirga caeni TaxID=2294115 RepID=A0A3M9M6J4_9MICO|nr:lipopolysaccharide biosynthesis protein [Flexivirga caeni]RNI21180.1 lipopolysaccharide biosynthesis protein [Flexivirga caeni]